MYAIRSYYELAPHLAVGQVHALLDDVVGLEAHARPVGHAAVRLIVDGAQPVAGALLHQQSDNFV